MQRRHHLLETHTDAQMTLLLEQLSVQAEDKAKASNDPGAFWAQGALAITLHEAALRVAGRDRDGKTTSAGNEVRCHCPVNMCAETAVQQAVEADMRAQKAVVAMHDADKRRDEADKRANYNEKCAKTAIDRADRADQRADESHKRAGAAIKRADETRRVFKAYIAEVRYRSVAGNTEAGWLLANLSHPAKLLPSADADEVRALIKEVEVEEITRAKEPPYCFRLPRKEN